MRANSAIHIGTSGWFYFHWDNFYPQGMGKEEWLTHYSSVFSTVEVNSSFYHLPLEKTVQNWFRKVPKDFIFSVKMSRYITHQKRLKDCKESLGKFFDSISALKNKLGPILIQLPPSFQVNKERLEVFISHLKKEYSYAFEFRHPSWFVEEIYEILAKNRIALCITDLNGNLSPEEITGDFTYIRLHGPQRAYKGSYGKAKLRVWKKKIEKWKELKKSVYCYFDNDEKGYAIEDAKVLKEMIKNSK